MTRRLSFTEAQCLSAMHNVPSYDEPATINHGAQVMRFIVCPQCHQVSAKTESALNRAAKTDAPVYCGRTCAGLARRKNSSDAEKKAAKSAYDAVRRKVKAAEIKAAKAAYYQKTRDPEKEAAKRKERMPRHVEYCRRPEYRVWKAQYDKEYRAKQEFGEFWESAILALEIRRECLALSDDVEIRRQAGTLNKHQQRRREYDRTHSNQPESGPLGYLELPQGGQYAASRG
jgi:hypothetical protein